jgi:3'-5' exoribonuclease 1
MKNKETKATRFIIVDLEATCDESGFDRAKMEIIEIGAVEMLAADAKPSREFARFIRPVATQALSAFCTDLTSITQADVDSADGFSVVFREFLDWIGGDAFIFCSWGQYDLNQIRQDCLRHDFPFPTVLENHINIKKLYAEVQNTRPMGMSGALHHAGLPLTGRHHRGIDDARNIAALARLVLPLSDLNEKI